MTIKEYLDQYKTNVYQLSMKCGIYPSSITRMLKGERTGVTTETAAKISAATKGKISIEEILYPSGIPKGARMARK